MRLELAVGLLVDEHVRPAARVDPLPRAVPGLEERYDGHEDSALVDGGEITTVRGVGEACPVRRGAEADLALHRWTPITEP